MIEHDFTVAVQSIFRMGFLPKGANSTIWALIPKKTDSMEMNDYRPNACCNVQFKVVSKILANRLKSILPRILLENQCAFVQGRLLMENVLLASELVKDYHKDSVSTKMCNEDGHLKSVRVCSMVLPIIKFGGDGFPCKLHTLDQTVYHNAFLISASKRITCGLFPKRYRVEAWMFSLSPYLFVLCMNVLSRKIDKAAHEAKFQFHPRCQSLSLTHLCFPDDVMVFVEG